MTTWRERAFRTACRNYSCAERAKNLRYTRVVCRVLSWNIAFKSKCRVLNRVYAV